MENITHSGTAITLTTPPSNSYLTLIPKLPSHLPYKTLISSTPTTTPIFLPQISDLRSTTTDLRSPINHHLTELANLQAPLEDSGNGSVVLSLYHALSSRNVQIVSKLLAPDLEWWFHGPPSHQFMMRLLTGTDTTTAETFQFVPQSIDAFGSTVIVEGCDQRREISWIHAWTVDSQGIITQVREYFNTSLTVTRFVHSAKPISLNCPSVWESSLSNRVGKSVPGLVLAI